MFSVAKEDLEALKRKNYRLIFILGMSGSGKATHCKKLVNEFKYTHISTGQLIQSEIVKKSKIGEACEKSYLEGQLVSDDLVIYLIVKAIVTTNAKNFLVDGFPRNIDQALYFEKSIREMGVIINLQINEETITARLKAELNSSSDLIQNRIIQYKEKTQPLIDLYANYGIVRSVNAELEVGKVYEIVKQQLYPAIYCLIGKKYSGKSTIANLLAQRMGLKVIDFNQFLNSELIQKRKHDDNFVITQFINRLREEQKHRVLIEDFPLTKEHYNIFTKNCKIFTKIFYLNVDDNNAFIRMNNLGTTSPEYIGCSQLNKELYEFDQKKDLIDYYRQKSNLVEIDVNNHLNLVIEDFIGKIKPTVLLFSYNKDEENSEHLQNDLISHFRDNMGYELLDVNTILRQNSERQTQIGKSLNLEKVEIEKIVNALKPVVFKEVSDKYIMVNYPETVEFFQEFERQICKIKSLIYISNSKTIPVLDNSIELEMKKMNRLFVYRLDIIDEYLINDILGKNRDLTVVYGMPLSGKSTISQHLKTNYNYTMINFVELILELKRIKGLEQDPPTEPESVEFTYPELLEGFIKYINAIPLNQKILLENIFQGLNELVIEVDQVKKLIEAAGRPRVFYSIDCREEVLLDRWKEVKGLTDEIQEDQKAEFIETLEKPKQICQFLSEMAYKSINVETNYSAFKSKLIFDSNFGKKMIVIKHDYDLNVDNNLYLFSARNQSLLVNVPNLIYRQFYLNKEWARRLQESYSKKNLLHEVDEAKTNEHRIYLRYNPIHFEENLVNELIGQYVLENSREIEETGNFIILTGYLNNDLLVEASALSFNLPLYEVKKLISLGELTAFIQFTHNGDIPVEESEVPEKPYVEEVKVKERDPLDVDGDMMEGENIEENKENNMEVPDGDENEKPKYKPELFAWTSYDGVPRNYVQTLHRLKKLPVHTNMVSVQDSCQILYETVETHLKNWETEQTYAGIINLTTIV